ncbi:unnamed protein product [Rotaria sp. Silwood1]|nr:unnamed protein product [Rotaria sp. Silwood1]
MSIFYNTVAQASFAQARIWLDERIRFNVDRPFTAIYNMPFLYRLCPGQSLSIQQLKKALQLIVERHQSLRTSLVFDTINNQLMQRVIDFHQHDTNFFEFIESTFQTEKELDLIIHNEKRNSQLFDLTRGLVFRCHIVYYQKPPLNVVCDNDAIIFNFHHAIFDHPSMDIFLHDLNEAYTTGQLTTDENICLRYLDYAIIEQQMSMTPASLFWLETLHNYNLDRLLSLPFDRHRLSEENRTGRGTSVCFDFGEDLSQAFIAYSSSYDITVEQLALASYYTFLFKLTNGESDLCVGMNVHGRYREELMSVIGMFVNAIPLRCQLNVHWSFSQLIDHVKEIMTNSLQYSYFPLQRILAQHPQTTKPTFLETSFEFQSYISENRKKQVMIGNTRLLAAPISIKIDDNDVMTKFDFALNIEHDLNNDQLSYTINASLDLFDRITVNKIAQRFHFMLEQIFNIKYIQMKKPLYELSLNLPDETLLMKSMNNTEVLFSSSTCIHHEFVKQAMKYSQKVAVELDDQSLTYSELLYYIQVLALNLVNRHGVIVGDIVCQCVERSLSMVIGMIAIEMSGGVYCPLSAHHPEHRLQTLIEQTGCRLVLTHHLTRNKFKDNITLIDIEIVSISDRMVDDIIVDVFSNVATPLNNMAYIIFTSGSTGTPKAVC